jgi:hypothetical protein
MLPPKLHDVLVIEQVFRAAISNASIHEIAIIVTAARRGSTIIQYVQAVPKSMLHGGQGTM